MAHVADSRMRHLSGLARSPMTRVVKVLWAAGKGSRRKALRARRRREKEARARSGFSGCARCLEGTSPGHVRVG